MSLLKGRSLVADDDFSAAEILEIFKRTKELKEKQKKGEPTPLLRGKTLAMIFEKPSTRTRVSFEVGIFQLGGSGLYLGAKDMQLGRGETISDTAKVLSRYVDGIMARTFSHEMVADLARFASVPVINGLTDLLHPCQALTDFYTIQEQGRPFKGLKFSYFGDGNNMTHSLMLTGALLGAEVWSATPPSHQPKPEIVERAKELAGKSGGKIVVTADPMEAARGADVLYTDVWASMGQEAEAEARKKVMHPYQVSGKLLKAAKENCLFMHCLPAHRGEEVAAEVIDSQHSIVFQEAENRLHVQKGIMSLLLGN